jgi:CheY-like chemotaxis protein
MKLLIVEDNAGVRRLIRGMVTALTQEIFECSDGLYALGAYCTLRPDFVLMDLEMPQLDGIEATRQIRAADPGARVIILTSHDDAQLRDAAREAGACEYIVKDNLVSLLQVLRSGRV